jgi:tetratricopeptide (TPR) repeat protein
MMALPMAGRLKFIPIMCAVAVFMWSMAVMYKTNYWKDNISFWEFWAARDNSQLAVSQLGYAYYDGKLYVKACDTLRMLQPVSTDPKFFEVLGNSCFETGKYQCALQAYESLLAFDARRGFALSQLTKMFQQLGDDSNSDRYSEMYRVYESQINENHVTAER